MQTYVLLAGVQSLLVSLVAASPVERQQTTCRPSFEYVRYKQVLKADSGLIRYC